MTSPLNTFARVNQFCERFGIRVPILLAPMAGACPAALSVAVANAGGMGACGALLMSPEEIKSWAAEVRRGTTGPVQINLWIPDPPPRREAEHENRVRQFLAGWGPAVPADAGDAVLPDFNSQCEALLEIWPRAVSSVMGLYPAEFVEKLKARGIAWFATVTTVGEAKLAEAAGADVLIAQGMEAGGHRGAFDASKAERKQIGLVSLLPAVVDAVRVPVIATGGIGDGRGVVAALVLGASAVMIGTGFLKAAESNIHPSWKEALGRTLPEGTMLTRAFSGRTGRAIATDYARAASGPDAPAPAPYPVQRGLTAAMRKHAAETGDLNGMQAWAGQSAALARPGPAGQMLERIWMEAETLLQRG